MDGVGGVTQEPIAPGKTFLYEFTFPRAGTFMYHPHFDSMTQELQTGGRIEIRGFGSFEVRTRNPRTGRNPKTGATVKVTERRVPFFKVGKELRERVNNGA